MSGAAGRDGRRAREYHAPVESRIWLAVEVSRLTVEVSDAHSASQSKAKDPTEKLHLRKPRIELFRPDLVAIGN